MGRNIGLGVVFIVVSVAVATAVIALISLVFEMAAIVTYIVSVAVALGVGFALKRLCFPAVPFFRAENLEKGGYWARRLKEKRFVKKTAFQAIYITSLSLSAVTVVAIVLFHALVGRAVGSGLVYEVVCAALGSLAVALLLLGVFGLKSVPMCKVCGAVGSLVYEGEADFELVSHYKGQEAPLSSATKAFGLTWGGAGGGWGGGKVKKFGHRVVCRCEKCGEKAVYTEAGNETGILQ